jgi:hypothetical protein
MRDAVHDGDRHGGKGEGRRSAQHRARGGGGIDSGGTSAFLAALDRLGGQS